ncbi:hypothetical protein [Clostridium algidicarnis]
MKASNIYLLGSIAKYLPFKDSTWESVIEKYVPSKTLEVNLNAFNSGKMD